MNHEEAEALNNCETAALILTRYAPLLASGDPRGDRLHRALVEVLQAGGELIAQDGERVPPPPKVEDLLREAIREAWKPPER